MHNKNIYNEHCKTAYVWFYSLIELWNKIQYKENSSFQQFYQKNIPAARQTWLPEHVGGWGCHNIQADQA